jgi:hypothetical protein
MKPRTNKAQWIFVLYESIVGQKLEGAANGWKYFALRGSRSWSLRRYYQYLYHLRNVLASCPWLVAVDRQVGECGAWLLEQSWRARRKRVVFSANMCLLTIMYQGFMYRTVFGKTAFLFATCWIGKLYYLCVCLIMLQYIVALVKR